MLKNGELDALILALPIETQGNQHWVLGKDPFKMVMHPDIAKSVGEPVNYSMLPDQSVFLLENEHCLTGHAVTACRLGNSKKINPFTASSLHSLVQMAEARVGATFVPQMAIEQGILANTSLVALTPTDGDAYREIGLVFRPTTSRRRTFRKVAETVAALLPESTLS